MALALCSDPMIIAAEKLTTVGHNSRDSIFAGEWGDEY